MRKLMISAAIAGAFLAAGAANAQQKPILVVDTDRILSECTACKAAATSLQAQEQQIQQRAQALEAQLKPEAESLQKAIAALGGKDPDAALQKRADAFSQRQQAAQAELQNKQRSLQSTVANVRQQVGTRAAQITEQVRARRQASVVLGKSVVIASDPTIDITGEVLAALNQQLPSVSLTPLPQQSTQGR